jgi:acetolactate synthase regulatory subunit
VRRHYLRVTAEAHNGLPRRIDSLVRRAGMTVQNRASRNEPQGTHHGFILSPSDDRAVSALVDQLRELGRVEQTLWLGVVE